MEGGEQLGRFLDGGATVDEDEETSQLNDPSSPRMSTYNNNRNSPICVEVYQIVLFRRCYLLSNWKLKERFFYYRYITVAITGIQYLKNFACFRNA